jgi:hypothetical protein
MKKIKLLLAISMIGSLSYVLYSWYIGVIVPPPLTPPKNTYTEEVQKKIDALSSLPATSFNKLEYEKIRSSIYLFYKEGSLGIKPVKEGKIWKNIPDNNANNLWNEILSKNLYAAYTNKFIDQANYVFNGPVWRPQDISFIRNELRELKKSKYLANDGIDAQKLNSISKVLNEYYQINNFISTCNNYTYTNFEIDENFPDLSDLMKKSETYLDKGFNNNQLNNCTSIKQSLKSIPHKLFAKHIKYFESKIEKQAPRYAEYAPLRTNQPIYRKEIYNKLKQQINEITSDFYGTNQSEFDNAILIINNQLKTWAPISDAYFKE